MASARETQVARERKAWKAEFEEGQRTREEAVEYEKYYREMKREGLEPLTFVRWREFIPQELKDNSPEVRGRAASNRATLSQINQVKKERYAEQKLTDEELTEAGFDLRWRPTHSEFDDSQIAKAIAIDLFKKFRDQESRFDVKHVEPVGFFLHRNSLSLSVPHIQIAWDLMLSLGIIQLPEPVLIEPEVQTNPELNQFGVNLGIDRDAELERKRYETEIVVVDPETGKGWTAYMLENQADSETYRRLMRIPRVSKNPALEPRH